MKKVIIFSAVLAVGALLALTGQVSAGPDASQTEGSSASAPKAKPRAAENCFYADSVEHYYTEDDNSMMVTDYRGRSFKLELSGACFGLDTAMRLAIRAKGSRQVCGPFDAEILYNDGTSGDRLRTCAIRSITAMTKEEADAYDGSDTSKEKKPVS